MLLTVSCLLLRRCSDSLSTVWIYKPLVQKVKKWEREIKERKGEEENQIREIGSWFTISIMWDSLEQKVLTIYLVVKNTRGCLHLHIHIYANVWFALTLQGVSNRKSLEWNKIQIQICSELEIWIHWVSNGHWSRGNSTLWKFTRSEQTRQ